MNISLFFLLKFKLKQFFKYNWETDSFNEMMKIVTNEDVIQITNVLLKKLVNDDKTTKKFLSCFMIVKNRSLVVTNETKLENDLIHTSNIIIDILKQLHSSKNTIQMYLLSKRFNKIYCLYIQQFDLWKKQDELNIVNNLTLMYFDLEADKQKRYENIDDETNKAFLDTITIEQQRLVEKIELIGGKEGLEYLDSLKKEIDAYRNNLNELYSSIDKNMHNAYWNSIKMELIKNPPNFMVIINLLKELKDMFIKCNPKLKEELDSNIDIDFIKEMLNRGVINDNYILNMSNYIIKTLKDLQSEEHDKELDSWASDMNEMFIKEGNYSEYFPIFFRYIFESIEITQKEMYIYNFLKQKREEN